MSVSPRAYRLPRHVRPVAYDIEIEADPRRSDFHGQVTIALEVETPSRTLELHARGLRLWEAVVEVDGQARPLALWLDADRQTVTLLASEPVPAGQALLRLRFAGRLGAGMHGLYLASDGRHQVLCTQCQATDARAIFPCFDEPEFKARLRWTVHTGPDLLVLTNGPLQEVVRRPEGLTYRFHPTPPLSTYLAALVIGDLDSSPQTVVRGTPVRVLAPRGQGGQTRFAHALTERLLPFYEDYFAYPYPYGKYDQVAVPGFDAGAMENAGLVLFRQNLLLMEPGTASFRQEQSIALVVAHEMAHMWFGNLVTLRWWDELWLNEAFAEWIAHKAVHALWPAYRVWESFQQDKHHALLDDALPTTHAIWAPVSTPEEAIEMFDAITYQKGCALMRMVEEFVGEEAFRQGLRAYIAAYAGGHAVGPDLWRHLEAASRWPVGELMRSWIEQPGFPLVAVELEAGGRLRLQQRRFFSSPRDAAAPSEQRWLVPMGVRFEDEQGVREHRFLLREREQTEPLPARGAVRWCYPNADGVGLYRLALDDGMLRALTGPALQQLRPAEQMGLQEDLWALVCCAARPIETFLEVLPALAQVRDHHVVRGLVDRLEVLDLFVRDSGDRAARGQLRALVARLLQGQLEELGLEPQPGEEPEAAQRRAVLVHGLASLARVPEVIRHAEVLAERERLDPRAVEANLAGVVVHVAARFGEASRHACFVATYLARRDSGLPPQQVQRYLYALAAFRPPELVARTLSLITDGTVPQDAVGVLLAQMLSARHAQEQAWAVLQANWEALRVRMGDLGLSRVVESVGHLRPQWRQDIVAFFQQHVPRGAERALQRALEAMDQREELRQRVTPGLLRWLGG
ncbi:MAG: M1 family metallopeptidase [Myxococcales bacterium]|nr:M1 family metallopeptidase [Myxococcota bacterium]MDW8283636.1 M1 family metallopeptidase [Myxococcales bacterium]